MGYGWVAGPGVVGTGVRDAGSLDVQGDERLRLSDVGKLARRPGDAWSGRPAPTTGLRSRGCWPTHLGGPLDDLEVVEESWPAYELVNVQVGLDTWLAGAESQPRAGRDSATSGTASSGSPTCCALRTTTSTVRIRATCRLDAAWRAGRTVQVRQAVRAALYLVRDERRPASAIAGARRARSRSGMGLVQLHLVADRPGRGRRGRRRDPRGSRSSTTCSAAR